MTLLTIVRNAAAEINLPQPSTVTAASDQTTRSMYALANREGQILAGRVQWSALLNEATFTSTGVELQGTMESIAPGYSYMLGDTIWQRDIINPIYGALTPQQWQRQKANQITGPYPLFRIRGGDLLMIPAPSAGETIAFEYKSRYWAVDATSGDYKVAFTADNDTSLLDEDIMTLGLKWRFLRSKGMDYAEELAEYESRLNDAISRDGTPAVLNMSSGRQYDLQNARPSDGSWSL